MPMVSSTSETKGMATAVRSMQSREKTKAMISCRMVPGTTSTQKPTRKSLWCGSDSGARYSQGNWAKGLVCARVRC